MVSKLINSLETLWYGRSCPWSNDKEENQFFLRNNTIRNASLSEFGQQTWWLAEIGRQGSEQHHRETGPFTILGLRKVEPVRARLPLDIFLNFEPTSRFEFRNSKIVRHGCRQLLQIILKNAVLGTGLTVGNMLHKWYDAASFVLVSSGRP